METDGNEIARTCPQCYLPTSLREVLRAGAQRYRRERASYMIRYLNSRLGEASRLRSAAKRRYGATTTGVA